MDTIGGNTVSTIKSNPLHRLLRATVRTSDIVGTRDLSMASRQSQRRTAGSLALFDLASSGWARACPRSLAQRVPLAIALRSLGQPECAACWLQCRQWTFTTCPSTTSAPM
jgi:hypothetical protein